MTTELPRLAFYHDGRHPLIYMYEPPMQRAEFEHGVDELVEVILPFGARSAQGPLPEGTLHLHRTDGHGEWLCRIAEGRMEVERVHGRGDVAVRGTGEQLDLVLWRRIEPDDVEVFGDLGVLAAWTALGR